MLRPYRFRAYADEARRYYVLVKVYPTAAEMYRAASAAGLGDLRDASAFTYRYHEPPKKARNCFGEVWLNHEFLDINTIAHEALHAAVGYLLRRKWHVCLAPGSEHVPNAAFESPEERLAYAAGYLTSGIIRQVVKKVPDGTLKS